MMYEAYCKFAVMCKDHQPFNEDLRILKKASKMPIMM